MSLSRRKFMTNGTLVVLSAGLPAKVLAESLERVAATSESSTVPQVNFSGNSKLNMQAFSRCLNTEFRLTTNNQKTVSAKLIEIRDRKCDEALNAKSKECFSAVFSVSANSPLRQATYAVAHNSLGEFSLFLVPVSVGVGGIHYEAVFNRL